MQYFKIGDDRYIEFNEDNSSTRIVVKSELQSYVLDLEARINQIDPNEPKTDQEWIDFGKSKYPKLDHSAEIIELERIKQILDIIRDI